jgi:hypothetical protein
MTEIFDFGSDLMYAETEALALYLMGKTSEVFDKLDPSVSALKDYLCLMKYFIACDMLDVAVDCLRMDYGLSDNKAVKLLDKLEKDETIKI